MGGWKTVPRLLFLQYQMIYKNSRYAQIRRFLTKFFGSKIKQRFTGWTKRKNFVDLKMKNEGWKLVSIENMGISSEKNFLRAFFWLWCLERVPSKLFLKENNLKNSINFAPSFLWKFTRNNSPIEKNQISQG